MGHVGKDPEEEVQKMNQVVELHALAVLQGVAACIRLPLVEVAVLAVLVDVVVHNQQVLCLLACIFRKKASQEWQTQICQEISSFICSPCIQRLHLVKIWKDRKKPNGSSLS
jgi:hypothetical protein